MLRLFCKAPAAVLLVLTGCLFRTAYAADPHQDALVLIDNLKPCADLPSLSPFEEPQIGHSWDLKYQLYSTDNLDEAIDQMWNIVLPDKRRVMAATLLKGVSKIGSRNCIELSGTVALPKYTNPRIAECMRPALVAAGYHEAEHISHYENALRQAIDRGIDLGDQQAVRARAIRALSESEHTDLDERENSATLDFRNQILKECGEPALDVVVFDGKKLKSLVMSLVAQPGYTSLFGYKYPKTVADEAWVPEHMKVFKPCAMSEVGRLSFVNPGSSGSVQVSSVTVETDDTFEQLPKPPFTVKSGGSVQIVLMAQAGRWNWVPHDEIANITITTSSDIAPTMVRELRYKLESSVPGNFARQTCGGP